MQSLASVKVVVTRAAFILTCCCRCQAGCRPGGRSTSLSSCRLPMRHTHDWHRFPEDNKQGGDPRGAPHTHTAVQHSPQLQVFSTTPWADTTLVLADDGQGGDLRGAPHRGPAQRSAPGLPAAAPWPLAHPSGPAPPPHCLCTGRECAQR